MDDIDRNLVRLLRRNARLSIQELSADLGVTRATVRKRLDALQANGEVLGFTVVTRNDLNAYPVRAITMIAIEGRGTRRVVRHLEGLPQVHAIHSTNGRWDLIIEVGTQSLERLDTVLNHIRLIEGVRNTETSLLLATRRASNLPAERIPPTPGEPLTADPMGLDGAKMDTE